jgi:hypothetical protein
MAMKALDSVGTLAEVKRGRARRAFSRDDIGVHR